MRTTTRLCVLILGASAVLGCSGEAPVVAAPTQEHALPVGYPLQDMDDWIRVPGEVVSLNRVALSSKISARICRIHVREGDTVQVGQLLVTLDNTDIEAGIRAAQASQHSAQAMLEDARRDLARLSGLHAKGIVTQQEIEKAAMRVTLESNQLALAEAQLDSALALRQDTELRSPMAGMLLSLERKVGDLVVPGLAVAQLLSDEKRFDVHLSPQQAARVQPGQMAQVQLAHDGQLRPAQLETLVESSGNGGRSFRAQLAFEGETALAAGLVGFALLTQGKSPHVWVPETALVERGGLKGVFVVSPEQQAAFRWLHLGRMREGWVEVRGGLAGDERLVLEGAAAVRQGDRVRARGE